MRSSIARDEPVPNSPDAESEWVLERIAQLQSELTELRQYESLYHEKERSAPSFARSCGNWPRETSSATYVCRSAGCWLA